MPSGTSCTRRCFSSHARTASTPIRLQGISNAVGLALAEKHLAAKYNRPGHAVVDHYTYVICGDGCLQEGVSGEASSFAGSLGLGKLIVLYDDNEVRGSWGLMLGLEWHVHLCMHIGFQLVCACWLLALRLRVVSALSPPPPRFVLLFRLLSFVVVVVVVVARALQITIDGPTSLSFNEDVSKRYEAYGWHTLTVGTGDDGGC